MSLVSPGLVGARTMRALRLALAAWALVWVGLAAYTAYEVYALRDLGNTVVSAGTAVETTGKALQGIAGIPFVGDRVGTLAGEVRVAGRSAVVSGRSSRASARNLGIVLGIAIALIPTLPVLGLYLPLRLAWRRERNDLARALRERPDDPLLEEYLARRALANLPYHELRAVSEQPWEELADGRLEPLAAAELRRLGLRRPAARERVR